MDDPRAPEPAPRWSGEPSPPFAVRGGLAGSVAAVCPYLVAPGGWRALGVSRDHRCAAMDPPGPVAGERQARVCLAAEHTECATYRASEELRAIPPQDQGADGVLPRPVVQTLPVLLDRRAVTSVSFDVRRRGTQLGLVAVMSVALAALIYARGIVPASERLPEPTPAATSTVGGSGGSSAPASGVTSPSAGASSTPAPSAETSPLLSQSPASTPSPRATESAGVSPSPASPSPRRTYVVKAGDTLVAIAARFGTTAAELRALNNIGDPRSLRVGQVLLLP